MRAALALLREQAPDLEVEGEMNADLAFSEANRSRLFPNSLLKGSANLLVMPNLDAANAGFNLLRTLGEGQSIGPMTMGIARPIHVLTPSITVRGLVNMSAVAVYDAQVNGDPSRELRPEEQPSAVPPEFVAG